MIPFGLQPSLQELSSKRTALVCSLGVVVGKGDLDILALQFRRCHGSSHVLSDAQGRSTPTGDFAVAPGLLGDPFERITTILMFAEPFVAEDDGRGDLRI